MKKKFAAMFMAAAMVFTMAACGQKADTPGTPECGRLRRPVRRRGPDLRAWLHAVR